MKKKTQKDYDKMEYENSKWIGEIWKDKNLPNKDPSKLHYREQQILAQRVFSEGHHIEAIIILHGLLEWELNRIWVMFVICNNPENVDTVLNLKERSYSDLVSLCEELDLFDKKKREVSEALKEFNTLRNSLSHNFYGVNQKSTPKNQIKKKFERGVNLAGLLPILELRYLYKASKYNKYAKNLCKHLEKEMKTQ